MQNFMSAMYHLKAIAEIVQRYYPETLHRLFIVNAPSAFVVMFKVIKPWLIARTLYKVHVLGRGLQEVLLQYIDEENLPDFLGGTCTCSHLADGCVPIGNKENFVPIEQNDKVPTVYNKHIMEAVLTDSMYCGISCTDMMMSNSTSMSTANSGTTAASSSVISLSKVT